MRLSELATKKIVNIYDGDIVGSVGDADLLIDPVTGEIEELIMPPGRFSSHKRQFAIPWQAIKKVGSEVIVVEIDENGRFE
jgi:YlmC/YmxH family sporulation protein